MIRPAVYNMRKRTGQAVIPVLIEGGGQQQSTVTPFDFNSVSDLIIYLNADTEPTGARTQWTDSKNNYIFTGNATRDTSINGTSTMSFAASAGQGFTSTANIAEISGLSALTVFTCHNAISVAGDYSLVTVYGTYGLSSGQFRLNHDAASAKYQALAVGDQSSAQALIDEPAVGAHVYVNQLDFSKPAAQEVEIVRLDGTTPAVASSGGGDNTGTFGLFPLRIGRFVSAGYEWAWSTTAILIYGRALSVPEMVSVENGIGALSGITF